VTRKRDPIRKIELADGRVRYRFVIDVGRKPDGKRDQRTFTFDTLKEARAERARIIHETRQGTYVKPSKTTLKDEIAGWLATKERGVKPTTLRHYVDVLKPVRDRYGHLPAQQLTKEHVETAAEARPASRCRRAR
jgi:hypothetical protein